MKNQIPQQIFSALILTLILFLGSELMLMNTVVAATSPHSPSETQLPAPVVNAVRQDLSRQVGIPAGKLRITEYTPKTWPDGCLGLPSADECTQMLVEGWRITVSDGRSSWVYRTDRKGLVLRLVR